MADGSKTTYVVLEQPEKLRDDGAWSEVGEVTCGGAEQACRQVFQAETTRRESAGDADPVGRLVAIPLRSWKPIRYEVERVLKVTASRG